MPAYPVQLEVSSPPQFQRIQLLVRLGIAIVLGILGIELSWLWSLLYFALPVIAAVAVSTRGPEDYVQKIGATVWSALRWLFAFTAYMLLLTDKISVEEHGVHVDMHATGKPAIGSALARLIMSIPSALALFFIGIVAWFLWLVALFTILVTRTVPDSILRFQAGYLRWQARLAAYHASLVDEYPPFSFGDREQPLPTAMVNP